MNKALNIINDIEEIAKLAPFIDELSDEFGLPPDLSFNLNLAIEEAITNVIMYAYPEATNQPIKLVAEMLGDNLVITLTDRGVPFDPTSQAAEPDIDAPAEERPIGGLGIFLIKKIMDSVDYQYADGCNKLTMVKKIINK